MLATLAPEYKALAALLVGALAGFAHFSTLRWNVRLLGAQAFLKAIVLQCARLALLAAVLVFLAKLGALPLLCGALGVFCARFLVVRRSRVPA